MRCVKCATEITAWKCPQCGFDHAKKTINLHLRNPGTAVQQNRDILRHSTIWQAAMKKAGGYPEIRKEHSLIIDWRQNLVMFTHNGNSVIAMKMDSG